MSHVNLRRKSEAIITARKWGVSLICLLLGVGLFVSEAKRIIDLPWELANIAYLLLFIITGVVILLWIWATEQELGLLFDWMDPEHYVPPSGFRETAIIVGMGFLLVGLMYGARNPVAFGIVFTAYCLAVLLSTRVFNKELAEVIQRSRGRLEGDQNTRERNELTRVDSQGIRILEEYFIGRPHTLRHTLCTMGGAVGLLLALWSKRTNKPTFDLAAYISYIVTIVVSEAVIARWRVHRDAQLRPLRAEKVELEVEAPPPSP